MRSKVENFLSLKILKIASNMKIPNENKIKFSDKVNKLLVNGILDISNKKNLKLLKYGIDEKNLEATAFAWFAFARDNQIEFKKSNITGAKRTYFLGNIY